MTNEKQIEANRKNAQKSTGPTTETGKAIVAQNAVKHGIFVKELVGSGNPKDLQELHANLIGCFRPAGQFEHILVETIAADIWRKRRLLRYEAGSIVRSSQIVAAESHMSDAEIDREVDCLINDIIADEELIKALQNNQVSFVEPYWEKIQGTVTIRLDIQKELEEFASSNGLTSSNEYLPVNMGGNTSYFALRRFLAEQHYSDEDIGKFIIKRRMKEISRKRADIEKFRNSRANNVKEASEKLKGIPEPIALDLIIRYEKWIQKSIYHTVMMLKSIQADR